MKQGVDSFNQMKSGDILGGIASTTNTVTGIVSGLASNQGTKLPTSAVNKNNSNDDDDDDKNNQTNTVGKDNLKAAQANNNFYANVGVNLGFNKSSSKSNSHSERAVVTAIKGKDENSSITYNNVKNVEYVGTQAQDTKFIYNNVENINKTAVELKNSYSSTGKSSGISTGVTVNYNNGFQAEGKEIVAFYDKVTKKIFINQNAKDEEVRASIAREYKIKEDLELGRGKANDKGQLRSTVAGEIAYDEIKDRLKKGDKNPISASSFDVAKMDKDSEVTSDLRDKNVQREFFNSLPYIATTSNGARKINPKVLKEMQGDKGELEDFIFRADFYIKSIDLLYAESEEGKKKIAIVNPIVDSLNKNSPDREYYKIIDGRKKEVLIASNPKPKSYLHHLLKSLDEFGNAPLHFLEAGDKFLSSDMKGAAREGFAAVNSLFKPATLGFGSKLGDEVGRVRKGSDQYGSKEEVEWKQEFIGSNIESVADMVAIYLTGKFVGTGVKLLDKKINYSNLTYDEYKFLKEYKNKPFSGEITSKYEDIRTGRYVTSTGDNIKEARKYLTDMGLNPKKIDKIVDSFAPQTLQVEIAGSKDYGIRFYDIDYKTRINPASPNGQYLFETFTSNINREGLALPPSWNQMTGIKQWQIEPGTIMLKGIADSQQLQGTQYIYPGGAEQIFIYQPWNYKTLLEP